MIVVRHFNWLPENAQIRHIKVWSPGEESKYIVCNNSDLKVVVEEAGGEGGGEERRRRRMKERKIDRHKTNFDC